MKVSFCEKKIGSLVKLVQFECVPFTSHGIKRDT
jgi:hypothetical protein